MTSAEAGPTLAELQQLLREQLGNAHDLVRAVASGRQRNQTVPYRRVDVRYVELTAGVRLQFTAYDDTQAHTKNLELDQAAHALIEELVRLPFANWHVESTHETIQIRVTKKGRPLVHRTPRSGPVDVDRRHDRAKKRRIEATAPLFAALGITSADGSVKPSRVAKFRQVQDLLAALDPVVDDAVALGPDRSAEPRPLRVADLGCGNAYLTFGAFDYLSRVRGLDVRAVGIDVKEQAREHNIAVADQLGISDRLSFVTGSIGGADLPEPPDLVLALHACDTATDEALARAVQWRAPVIVAAPCCHHDIQRQLSHEQVPAPFRLITRHGILRERLGDVLTDAFRAAILRLVGYRVEVIEFVDSAHTPRNALIRAVRTGAPASDETRRAYAELVAQWQVQPALAAMLADSEPVVAELTRAGTP